MKIKTKIYTNKLFFKLRDGNINLHLEDGIWTGYYYFGRRTYGDSFVIELLVSNKSKDKVVQSILGALESNYNEIGTLFNDVNTYKDFKGEYDDLSLKVNEIKTKMLLIEPLEIDHGYTNTILDCEVSLKLLSEKYLNSNLTLLEKMKIRYHYYTLLHDINLATYKY